MSRKRKNSKVTIDPNVIPTGGNGKIYVGFPRERIMIPEFVDNRDQVLVNINRIGRAAGYFSANGHRVDKNRDNIVDSFMKHEEKPEWLLQLDTDMEHPQDIAEVLVNRNKAIIGGLYFHRGQNHDPFIFRYVGDLPDTYGRLAPHWAPMRSLVYDFLDQAGLPFADGSFHIKNPPFDPVIECDAVATGSLLVHRSVFERIPRPHFEYRDQAISEDLMFCRIAQQYGYKIWCDMSVISGHYKFIPVGQAQFRTMYEALSIRATQFTKEDAYKDVSSYLDIPFEEAKRAIDEGSASVVGSYWKEVNPKTDEEIAAFYRDPQVGKLYIIELMYWNMSDSFTKLRSNLRKIRKANILELGAGIGTLTCQMAIQMNNVTAFEPNDILRGFMKMRIGQMISTPGMECTEPSVIEGEKWWDKVPDNSQDYVMAFDVFEHIPEKELRNIIDQVGRKLKKGHRLLYHNNWSQQEGSYPMHLDHSAVWEEMLESAGLAQISPLEAIKK